MTWLSITFVAVAVSFDALAIGITYGMARISVSYPARIILSTISGCAFFAAMVAGQYLQRRLAPSSTNLLGGLILILLGLYTLWRSNRSSSSRVLVHLRIPVLGLIIQVFQEPLSADYDHSQHISLVEALILGAALALDATAAGIGAAILQFPIVPTVLAVITASLVFISKGLQLGKRLVESPLENTKMQWIPGLLIIFIGLLKIMV